MTLSGTLRVPSARQGPDSAQAACFSGRRRAFPAGPTSTFVRSTPGGSPGVESGSDRRNTPTERDSAFRGAPRGPAQGGDTSERAPWPPDAPERTWQEDAAWDEDEAAYPPDITVLRDSEREAALPTWPVGDQMRYFTRQAGTTRIIQWVAALTLGLITSKAALISVPAFLFPVWRPWVQAGVRNLELLSQVKALGLWRTQVLDVRYVDASRLPGREGGAPPRPGGATVLVELLLGDVGEGGAQVALSAPMAEGAGGIRVGDDAELLVASRDELFDAFQAIREVYLPRAAVWLAEYPLVDRRVFVNISLDIERGRGEYGVDDDREYMY